MGTDASPPSDDDIRAMRRAFDEKEAALSAIVKPVLGQLEPMLSDALGGARVWSGHYGATGIDPVHLVVYVVVPRRADVSVLEDSGAWDRYCHRLREALGQGGYPVQSLPDRFTLLTSQQACDEEAGGNWYHFFK